METPKRILQFTPKVNPIVYVRGLRRISANAKLVMFTLASRVNDYNECWPSVASLADDTGLSRRAIFNALRELTDQGLIERTDVGKKTPLTRLTMCQPGAQSAPEGCTTCTGGVHDVHTELTIELTIEEKGLRAMKNSDGVEVGFQEEDVVTMNPLAIHGRLRKFWSEQFGNDADLDLALMQIEPYLQTRSFNYSAEKMVSSQLSRIVRERNERQRRYEAAKAEGQKRDADRDNKVIDWDSYFADREARKANGAIQ